VSVRPHRTLAQLEGGHTRSAAPGDIVILPAKARPVSVVLPTLPPPGASTTPAPAQVTATTATLPAAAEGAPIDREARELSALFTSLRGATPAARINAYDTFSRERPQSRFRTVLEEEAAALRALVVRTDGSTEPVAEDGIDFAPIARAPENTPLSIAIELAPRFGGAVLHSRHRGDRAYVSAPMHAVGRGYFSGVVASEHVRAPGVEYFIEGVETSGAIMPLVGTATEPRSAVVDETSPVAIGKRPLVIGTVLTDYASFDARSRNDFVWQTEGSVGARFGDEGIRAIRSGFGVYRGRGGTLEELDKLGLPGRGVGLTYGHLEGEYAFTPLYSLVLRGILGLKESGISGGAQAFLRIGNDRRTNLLLGGEVLGGIGLRGITELQWNTIHRVPIVLRTEVTTQPAGTVRDRPLSPPPNPDGTPGTPTESNGQGEIGVRAIVQVGYRLTDAFTLSGRVSYQGRTINHSGPGAGAAVSYEW
jgi:hypothetical protein